MPIGRQLLQLSKVKLLNEFLFTQAQTFVNWNHFSTLSSWWFPHLRIFVYWCPTVWCLFGSVTVYLNPDFALDLCDCLTNYYTLVQCWIMLLQLAFDGVTYIISRRGFIPNGECSNSKNRIQSQLHFRITIKVVSREFNLSHVCVSSISLSAI